MLARIIPSSDLFKREQSTSSVLIHNFEVFFCLFAAVVKVCDTVSEVEIKHSKKKVPID